MRFEFVPGPGLSGKHEECPVCAVPQNPRRSFQVWHCHACRRLLYSHYDIIGRMLSGRWQLFVDRLDMQLRIALLFAVVGTFMVKSLEGASVMRTTIVCAAAALVAAATYIIEAAAIFATGIAPGSIGPCYGRQAMTRGILAIGLGLVIASFGLLLLYLAL